MVEESKLTEFKVDKETGVKIFIRRDKISGEINTYFEIKDDEVRFVANTPSKALKIFKEVVDSKKKKVNNKETCKEEMKKLNRKER